MTNEFDWVWNDNELETGRTISSRSIIRTNKRRMLRTVHQETMKDVIVLPAINESLHLISNGVFDFFTIAAMLIDALGGHSEHFYASTWTINQQTIMDLFDYYDTGKIGRIYILSDVTLKRRKPEGYAHLIDGLRQRGQQCISNHNHSKIVLLNNGDNFISIEGSASFTTNPRIEQHCITNDKELWAWHRSWMDELLSKGNGNGQT